jgi:hypothetical protein
MCQSAVWRNLTVGRVYPAALPGRVRPPSCIKYKSWKVSGGLSAPPFQREAQRGQRLGDRVGSGEPCGVAPSMLLRVLYLQP